MFRKIFHQVHLYLGIVAGIVIFVVALSGSVLVFREELDDMINSEYHFTTKVSGEGLAVDHIAAEVKKVYPNKNIKAVHIPHEANRNIIFRTGNKKDENILVYADKYTGKVVGALDQKNKFVEITLQLHRFLLMKQTGKIITGISCIIFIVMLISGLILWWPKNKRAIKHRLKIKWNGNFKRKNWDLHAVFGFYSFIFLMIIACTGLVFAYKPVNEMLFKLADGKMPPKNEVKNKSKPQNSFGNTILDRIVSITDSIYSFKGDIDINFPQEDIQAIAVNKRNAELAKDNVTSRLYFDRNTGELLQLKPYQQNTLGQKIRQSLVPIHTGSIYGWPTKLIAFLVSIFAASFPVTGTLILINRKQKKKRISG